MAFITYRFADGTRKEIKVTEEFAAEYAKMEYQNALIERKETRRHQSLDKSLEHGFDIPDPTVDITEMAERRELSDEIHKALNALTEKQRKVFELYVSEGLPFRAVGERMGLGTYTVRDYFYNAVKKLKKRLGEYEQLP